MKLTDLALLWVIISWPMQVSLQWQYSQALHTQNQHTFMQQAIRSSLDDATFRVALMAEPVHSDVDQTIDDLKNIAMERELASGQLLKSLQMNYPQFTHDELQEAILFFVALEYDGFSVYKNGWSAKYPYDAVDSAGHHYQLTFGEQINWYDAASGNWWEGKRAELFASYQLPPLRSSVTYTNWRKRQMMLAVEKRLSSFIGQRVQLLLPVAKQQDKLASEWGNVVDDVGFLLYFRHPGESERPSTVFATSKLKRDAR